MISYKNIPSVYNISEYLKPDKILPLYFFCGEDEYTIDTALQSVEKAVHPLIGSDFDREVISCEKSQNLAQILDLAFSFPFGGGKKLLVLKNFEKLSDKKGLADYAAAPPEFTVVAVAHYGKIPDAAKEPFSTLLDKNFIFEARKLKGAELADWITRQAKRMELSVSADTAQSLIEIVGEDKGLIEMHLRKFADYLGKNGEITFEVVRKLSSTTKEYTIFELQDALGKGNKQKSLEIAFNLLDAGQDIVYIVTMLGKFILTAAQIMELRKTVQNDFEASKLAGISKNYYVNVKNAGFFMADERLLKASKALLNADLAIKTTNNDPKSIILILIAEMLS